MLACRSWIEPRFYADLKPNSSVLPYASPPLDPPPAAHIVNPYGLWSRPVPLSETGVADFAAPDNQRLIVQALALQIEDESRCRTVHVRASLPQVNGDIFVIVPYLTRCRYGLCCSYREPALHP